MRDMLIVGGALVIALVIGLVLFFYNSGAPTAPSDRYAALGLASPVRFTVLAQGSDAPADTGQVNYRITDADQFASLWGMVNGSSATPPAIDFSKDEVLAVFDGSHSTTGYTVAITSVVDADSRMVTVEHGSPADSCDEPVGASSPYEVIEVPATALPILHVDTDATVACQ